MAGIKDSRNNRLIEIRSNETPEGLNYETKIKRKYGLL